VDDAGVDGAMTLTAVGAQAPEEGAPEGTAWLGTLDLPVDRKQEEREPRGLRLRTRARRNGAAGKYPSGTRPASKTLIGGEEADLVPLIPDTKPEIESVELDDEAVAAAAVVALHAACELMVRRVNQMRTLRAGAQIVSAMVALVGELDARYAGDWGIVRRNGLAEVLTAIHAEAAEGDRFVLESLESGRGGLTAEAFVRDLKLLAESDRPRIVAEYVAVLTFVFRCVLRQYLRPLDRDPETQHEVAERLDYLIDGVHQVLKYFLKQTGLQH